MCGDRGRISPAVSAMVGTPRLLPCKLPGDSSICFPSEGISADTTDVDHCTRLFIRDSNSNHQSDLHHEGLYPLNLLTGLEILFVVLMIEVRARRIPLPVSHIPIQHYFLSETMRFSLKHHRRVTGAQDSSINIFLNNQTHIKTLSPCLLPKCSKDFLLDIFFFISK